MNAGAAMVWASLLCAHVAALAANRRNTLPIECLWWLGCIVAIVAVSDYKLDALSGTQRSGCPRDLAIGLVD